MIQATPTFPGAPPRDDRITASLTRRAFSQLETVSPRDRWIYAILALTLVLNLLDGIFTLFAVRTGLAVETNPLMNELLARGPMSFMLGKVAMVSLGVLVLWRLRRLRMAVVGSYTALAVYGGIFVWHLYGLGG